MCSIESRLNSFKGWPTGKTQKPDQLAIGGFYYYGTSDRVICFYCGLGLKDWKPEDNIWLEHALHSSKCPYLLLNKGLIDSQQIPHQTRTMDLFVRMNLMLENKRLWILKLIFLGLLIGVLTY